MYFTEEEAKAYAVVKFAEDAVATLALRPCGQTWLQQQQLETQVMKRRSFLCSLLAQAVHKWNGPGLSLVKETPMRGWETTWWTRVFQCKGEDLSLDPKHPRTKLGAWL